MYLRVTCEPVDEKTSSTHHILGSIKNGSASHSALGHTQSTTSTTQVVLVRDFLYARPSFLLSVDACPFYLRAQSDAVVSVISASSCSRAVVSCGSAGYLFFETRIVTTSAPASVHLLGADEKAQWVWLKSLSNVQHATLRGTLYPQGPGGQASECSGQISLVMDVVSWIVSHTTLPAHTRVVVMLVLAPLSHVTCTFYYHYYHSLSFCFTTLRTRA